MTALLTWALRWGNHICAILVFALVRRRARGGLRRPRHLVIVPPANPGSQGDAAMVLAMVQNATVPRAELRVAVFDDHASWPEVEEGYLLRAPWVVGRIRPFRALAFLRAVQPDDAFVWVATDTLDGGHNRRFLGRMTAFLRAVQRRGAGVSIVNFSLRPGVALDRNVEVLLRRARHVVARDAATQAQVAACGIREVGLAPDVAFSLHVPRPEGTRDIPVLQVNVSGHAAMLAGGTDLLSVMCESVVSFVNQVGTVSLELLVHDSRPVVGDLEAVNELSRRLTDAAVDHQLVGLEAEPSVIRTLAARADLVVTTRMHHAIAATTMGTPVVCVTYFHEKFVGQLGWLGLPDWLLVPGSTATPESVLGAMTAAWTARSDLAGELAARMPGVAGDARSAIQGYVAGG